MGKFGKKVDISLNPLDYNLTILGESGIGKTTIAKEMCEKLVGDEGYIHFDIGFENGSAAIQGIVSEPIPDYAKLKEVVEDIVENKGSDYKELKVVIWDTFDELVRILEDETIRQHNKKHPDNRTDSINSAMGGFGRGQDYAIKLFIDCMAQLREVGVSSIIIGHVKRTDIIDPYTQETYSKITADTTQRYFNAIKNKQHFVALAYIDREIVKEKTGRKNIVNKQDITFNKAISESRIITFRDDTYSVDSKSRFADIVDRVPFNVDEFIKAMQDAIEKEKTKDGKSLTEAKKEQKVREKEKEAKAKEYSESAKNNKVDPDRNEELKSIIVENFKQLKGDAKTEFKQILKDKSISSMDDLLEMPTSDLQSLADYFN